MYGYRVEGSGKFMCCSIVPLAEPLVSQSLILNAIMCM